MFSCTGQLAATLLKYHRKDGQLSWVRGSALPSPTFGSTSSERRPCTAASMVPMVATRSPARINESKFSKRTQP
ncbi:hypothetical protein BS78_06G255500 [Paspalum vaginatum]|nr:hypothetical protein BS78_06G255500 [Paspalum vaginatum]